MNLRQQMPNVARLVDEQRQLLGKEYVNDVIRRAVAGERDLFWAFEAGHVIGTPFEADTFARERMAECMALGGRFAMLINPKAGPAHGAA